MFPECQLSRMDIIPILPSDMATTLVDPQRNDPLMQKGVPDAAQLALCLERIRSSAEFVRSERMVRFLEVTVRHAVESRGGRLTERQLGCEVFDRPQDWDPSVDTIVRSEARRFRSKLEQYYERQGRLDPIRICIPKGGYLAEFQIRTSPPEDSAVPPGYRDAEMSPGSKGIPIGRRTLWAAVFLLLLAVLGYRMLHRERELNSHFDIRIVSSEPGTEYSPAISPDGKRVAYVWDDQQSEPDIYIRGWSESPPHRLSTTPALRLYPSWSRDGRSLAYLLVQGEEVFVMVRALASGEEVQVAHMKRQVGRWSGDAGPLLGPPGPSWTPDGALIVADYDPTSSVGALFHITTDGRRTMLLQSEGVDHHLYPRVSPDGTTLAYVRYTSHGQGELFTMPIAGGTPRQLTKDSKTIQGVSWSPDGRSLLFSSNRRGFYQLWLIPMTGGEASPVATNSTSATEPVYTPGGDILFVDSRENWNIWRRPLAGATGEERIIASSGRNYDPRYSPDSRQIAFVSDRAGTMELWVADANGAKPRQLTHLGGTWLGGIAWSPDGHTLAFDARVGQRSAVYLIPTQGGTPQLLESNLFEERMPAWSPDSGTIYFNSNRDGELAIWRRHLATGKLQKVASKSLFAVACDGDKLILSTRTGTLWTSELDGSHLRPIDPELKAEPVMSWFPNRGSLYLTRDTQGAGKEILVVSPNGQRRSLGTISGSLVPNAPDIAVSPDDRFLLIAKEDVAESDLKLRHGSADSHR